MATKPVIPRQTAPLPPLPQQPRPAVGMYLPSDQGRPIVPRGADRAMFLPSDEGRIAPSRGAERGMILPSDERRPLPPTGAGHGMLLPSDDVRPLPSKGNVHGMVFPSDEGRPLLPWGNEGSIFLASDDHVLTRQVQQLHNPDARPVNVRPLFHLVRDIIDCATQNVEGPTLGTLSEKETMEGKHALYCLEEVPELPLIIERISSEITCKILSGIDAHSTTFSVLKNLQHFTWEAKVVLTLAAFALTYGDFWLLVQIYSTNALAKSMALIKQLPLVVEHKGAFKHHFEATNNLIRAMLETTQCIVEFGQLPPAYITDEDPAVKDAMSHFPIAVYWIIRSAVSAATQITTLSSRGFENVQAITEARELSNWAHKLQTISDHLRSTLSNMYKLIGDKRQIEAYNMILKIVYHTIHVDNMKVLKILIYANDDVPPLYDGPNKRRVHLDVLRGKHVLLLISGLDITHEEVINLEQSYNESKTHSYEIVWIPVLDPSVQWTEASQGQLETLQNSMPWYSVHHPSIIGNAAIKFFRDDWHFNGKPILAVLGPQGQELNKNAIHMMWIWQNLAYDFTATREQQLWEQERWTLEFLVDSIDTRVQEWIRDGKYIFLYGGDDIDWMRKFTTEAHSVAHALQVSLEMVYVGKSHSKELVRRVCATIMLEQLSHCWQDPTLVWYFWTRIESMIFSKIKLGKVHDHGDLIWQEIQRLHSHDKSHGGWALLAKGSTILVQGPGRLALTALLEMDSWKHHGFERGYTGHIETLYLKEYPCHRIEFPATVVVPESMPCPECRRLMHKYNTFKCCHEDAMAEAGLRPADLYEAH